MLEAENDTGYVWIENLGNYCGVKRRRGRYGPLTLRACLFQQGHVLRQLSERSVWRLITSGTHCRSTFATPAVDFLKQTEDTFSHQLIQ